MIFRENENRMFLRQEISSIRKVDEYPMNEKALHILEFDKVIEKLTDQAHSLPGKEKCKILTPMEDFSLVERAQCETADAVARVLRLGKISFQGNRDLSFSLHALTLGSTLSQADEGLLARLSHAGVPAITVEEHVLTGGLGTAAAECCARHGWAAPRMMLALPDGFVPHGNRSVLLQRYGLTADQLAAKIRKAVGR